MDTWQTEWSSVEEVADFESSYISLESDANTEYDENAGSPNINKTILEYNRDDKLDKSDSRVISTTLAKRRLQAYSNKLQIKVKVPNRDEKRDDDIKSPMKKMKKALYPDEKAKAVIHEIEEIKKQEAQAQEEWMTQEKTRELVAAAIKSITNKSRTTSRSSSSEKESHFKKRNISARNYRRTDSFGRRSNSPDRESRRSSKPSYPKNWSEYREQRLTVVKDTELKKKLLNLSTPSKSDLCLQLYNFNTPPHLLEPFTFVAKDDSCKEIPVSFMRVTKARPHLTYSINYYNNKSSFVNRTQLFQMISTERQQLIEKLINIPSKLNSSPKKNQTRHWYHKSWKKSGDAECKILENSVGLSFLQNYSDEEEENDEEQVIICSSAKTKKMNETGDKNEDNEKKKIINKNEEIQLAEKHTEELSDKNKMDNISVKKLIDTNEEKSKVIQCDIELGEIIEETDNQIGEYTPEKKNELDDISHNELYETKKAIKELEAELVKKSSSLDNTGNNKTENRRKEKSFEKSKDKKEKKKKTRKRSKKKVERSSSDDEDIIDKPKNKKVKKKFKKKCPSSDDEESSEEEEKRKKRSKKKIKHKKDTKKIKNKAENDSKISKSKKKDDSSEEDSLKLEKKKKKKKNKLKMEEEQKTITDQDSKKKQKRKKLKKVKQNQSSDELDEEQKDSEIDKCTKKKKKNSCKKGEVEIILNENKYDSCKSKIVDYANLEQENLKTERSNEDKPNKTRKRKKSLYDNEEANLKEKKPKNEGKYKANKLPSEISVKQDLNYKSNEDIKTKHLDKLADIREKEEENKFKSKKNKDIISPKERSAMDYENEKKLLKKKSKEIEFTCIDNEFPLEKDTYRVNPEQKEVGTPTNEEYQEHWKTDPLWETDEKLQPKKSKIFNSSWESDEEVFEQVIREPEKPRSFIENFDLEIPLNIKPFKRREKIDTDTELQFLKFESKCLSEERRQLEIEKIKVKELELQVMKEVQVVKNKIEYNYKDDKPKRYRWDKKIAEPKTSNLENFENIFDIVKEDPMDRLKIVESNESDTSAVLENEYEEFMKALSSKTESIHSKIRNTSSCIDLTKLDNKKMPKKSIIETPDILISPKDIPFIPMPDEIKNEKEILQLLQSTKSALNDYRPVPVPSPRVDIDIIPKPLKQLNLSTNITVDVGPKIDLPNKSSLSIINHPGSLNIRNILKNEDVVSSSSIETVNYNFKEHEDVPAVQLCSQMQNEHLSSVSKSPLIMSNYGKEVNLTSLNQANDNISSSTTDVILTPSLKDSQSAKQIDLGIKPFSFSGMVLPTKKVLLDNSNLNLGDSDDENSLLNSSKVKTEQPSQHNPVTFGNIPIDSIRENMELIESEKVSKQKLPQNEFDLTNIIKEQDSRRVKSKSPSIKPSNSRISSRMEDSPRRSKRELSPRRRRIESPSRDRRSSPRRYSSPGRRRSPSRRKSSPAKRRHLSHRSRSPVHRRSVSPRKKSPRSNSPRFSFKRNHSKSPEKSKSSNSKSYQSPEKNIFESNKNKSPITVTSPLERLKRSVADSTISDDLLPQPSNNLEDFNESPNPQFYKNVISPTNVSLGVGMNQMLHCSRDVKQVDHNYKTYYDQYSQIQQYMTPTTSSNSYSTKSSINHEVTVQNYLTDIVSSQNSFVQIGNMVEIVPTEIPIKAEVLLPPTKNPPIVHKEKSQIVQIGNMLEIVPTDFSDNMLHKEEPKIQFTEVKHEEVFQEKTEKQSAEEMMKIKTAERRAEREKRRLEKEQKRKEKEKRREEKEKQRQIKMKQKTENMIKQALQLEVEGLGGEEEKITLIETPTQWPPIPVLSSVSKDFSRGILIRSGIVKRDKSKVDKRKVVQFADGVRPGEGTSPSGGEELSSPPTPKIVLPKEKRYTKTKFHNKIQKKKVKVKVIKKLPEPESDEDDNLPPPSPPPGSPPPHLFPPRVKAPMINNTHPYATAIAGVQTLQTVQPQNHQQIFRQQTVNLIMVPPPPPHHIPPPPPHHGPPPPHHGPPPPPSHHHGPPPPHHHGPPPPPHHHGPPPPHHHPPPPGPPFHRPPFHR